jgi:hypothetical protein
MIEHPEKELMEVGAEGAQNQNLSTNEKISKGGVKSSNRQMRSEI